MTHYKVLLVDDEEDVRQSIVAKLRWEELGFRVVGEAGNGEEALELAERLEPDIVMTDIKMPFMDGLELCRRVKRLLPGVRVAVFSGFDEFEYAKEAISQQVEEYILKPIDAAELTGVFRRLRERLDAEIAARRDLERLRRHYEESLPLMRQQVLMGLLENRLSPGELEARLAQYRLDLTAGAYCVAVVRQEADKTAAISDAQLAQVSLLQILAETLEGAARFHLVQMPDRIALLFLLEEEGEEKRVTALLGQLFPAARRLLGSRLSIGMGGVYPSPGQLHQSYAEARGALEYQLIVEPGQVIHIGDIEPGAAGDAVPDPKYADELLRQIKVGGEEELREAVGGLVRHLKGMQTGIQQYQIYLLELFTGLLQLIRTYRMDPEEARQDLLLSEGVAMRASSLDELGRWLLEYCENLRVLARRQRKDSVRLLIDRAKELIEEQYADSELSLDAVCAQLNVSAAYFSTIFKKETGLGFVGYLTDLRMKQAIDLLATTDDKTYQIAERVGYTDPNYFSYVFKRHFGTSPSKYKTDRLGAR